MANYLITGATGRLGTNIVSALLERGDSVRALVMPGDPQRAKLDDMDVEIFEGDLTQTQELQEAVKGMDRMGHFAAIMDEVPEGMTNPTYFDINTRGTYVLMDAACREGLEKVVYTSSTAVYDVLTVPDIPIRENSELKPRSEYGCTKVAAEEAVMSKAFRHDMPTIIIRPSFIMACDQILDVFGKSWNIITGLKSAREEWCGFYQPGLEGTPWKKIAEKAEENPRLSFIPYGPGKKSWYWHVTDVRDVVQAVLLAFDNEDIKRDIFTIAGPEPAQFDEAVKYKCGKLNTPYEDVETQVYWQLEMDISKARSILGYNPQYDVKRMIDDAVRFRNGEDIGVIPATL